MVSELKKIMEKFYPHRSFELVQVNKKTIGSFFKYKDQLPKAMRSCVIYKYSCASCNASYIGETKRQLTVRVSEHQGRSFRTNNLLLNPSHSAIRDHMEECDTPFNLNNFEIIGTAQNVTDLQILESLFIVKMRPTLNNMTSSYQLHVVSKN